MEKAQPQIAAWMKAKKMKQKELAVILGITPETVSRLLSGEYTPGETVRKFVAFVTGLDVADKGVWK